MALNYATEGISTNGYEDVSSDSTINSFTTAFTLGDSSGLGSTALIDVSNISSTNTTANATELSFGDGFETTEWYYEDNDYFLRVYDDFEVATLGIARLTLILVTALANVFVFFFFMTKKNRGRATNLLFVSIAFSDTMTGVVLLPNSIYVYLMGNNFLTRSWCEFYMISRFYLSRVFHTVSVWQTVVLCIQRYMCVCHPFISGRICTAGKTFVTIVTMYIFAAILHLYHVIDDKVIEYNMMCAWDSEDQCSKTCLFLWCSVIFQHFLPCLILVCLTIVTLVELQKANRRVSSMSNRSTSKRSSRDRIITITTTLVVLVFLVPELPHGIYKVILVVSKQFQLGFHNKTRANHMEFAIYEIVLLVSFHANFWIYCSMMHDFRHAFVKLVTFGLFKRSLARMRTFSGSLSSRKGSVNRTLSCSSSVVGRNRILSQTTSIHSTASDPLHAVVPMTPAKNRKTEYLRVDSIDDHNDDVFV